MTRRSTSRSLRVALAAAGALTLVAGCSSSSSHSEATGAGSATTSASKAGPAPSGLQSFYSQKLEWEKCDEGECAKLRVPIDYAKPSGATIEIAVNRQKATGTKKGSLVVNPGGPGASGVDYAAAADSIVSSGVRESFDVVGFDPRGVQRSAAITCVGDAELDDLLGADPSPDNAAEQKELLAADKSFADACKKNAGPLLGHVSTEEAAKDMDVLRAALGEDKLDYLGKSYGTFLGASYAEQFPKKVGRMVLDGVLPPDLTMAELNAGQAKGFETALDAYLASCAKESDCPLGSEPAAGKKKLQEFLAGLDDKTVRAEGDSRIDRLTEGWAVNGIAAGLYDEASWPGLTDALRGAMNGDGTLLLASGKQYAERNDDGTYNGNIMQVINAVTCLDRPAPTGGVATYEKETKALAKDAPTWGSQLAWAGAICADWPVKATGEAKSVKAAGSGPIVVVGTTRDPATPYEWSERLEKQLENGRLVSYDGDGHTAYGRGSECVDSAIDSYLLEGKNLPEKTTC